MTVFRFRLALISKKTVRNTVNLSTANRLNSLDVLLIPFVIQRLMLLRGGS
jgi:hypothetical protein